MREKHRKESVVDVISTRFYHQKQQFLFLRAAGNDDEQGPYGPFLTDSKIFRSLWLHVKLRHPRAKPEPEHHPRGSHMHPK